MAAPQHIYETFIKATPAEVWQAIIDPAFTRRYFHETSFESSLDPGSGYRYVLAGGDTAVDGTVEEVEPERRLLMTWHVLYDTEMSKEVPSRVEWRLQPANADSTVTRVTVRHFDLGMSPLTSDSVRIGWVAILDSMKSLLETGESLGDVELGEPVVSDDRAEHRRLAIAANNETWDLLTRPETSAEEQLDLVETAMTSHYHWRRAADPDTAPIARGAWLVSRSAAVAGLAEVAMMFAQRCAALTRTCIDAADFDHAYALEGLARASAALGDLESAERFRSEALAVEIANDQDREIAHGDLADGPWFGLDVPG